MSFSCKHLYFIVVTLQSPNEWCICGKFCILFRQWHEFLFFYRSLKRRKRRNQKRKKFDSSVVNWWFAVIQTTQHPTAGVHTATCLNGRTSSWSPRVRRVTLPTEWAFVNPVKQSYSKVPRTVHFKHNSLYPCRFSVCFILW